MKSKIKIVFVLLIIPFLTAFDINKTTEDFIGRWKGEDKGDIGYIIFDKEGYATFKMGNQVIGGKEFVLNGEKGKMTYKINTTLNPIQIDFTVTKFDSKEVKTLLGIAEFIDNDRFKLALGFGFQRPEDFSKNTIIFNREKSTK